MTYGMLIDLKKCVGCHACSVACKEAHGTRPGVRRSRVDRVFEGTYPDVRKTAYPMLCMHCETAPCVEVCPQDATYKREDGIVVIDKGVIVANEKTEDLINAVEGSRRLIAKIVGPEDEVLKLWQGLGYYSRARNLRAAAREVVERFGGVFPRSLDDVRSLRGVGDYTAAAICSAAYDAPCAVVDGNVYRVLSRLFDLAEPIDTTAGKRAFACLAQSQLDAAHPGRYNQAIMDFGAIQCTPASPRCEACPLSESCLALAAGTVADRPVKRGKTRVRDRWFNYLHVASGDRVLLHRREGRDIWQGLYEFPLIETDAPVEFPDLAALPQFRRLLGDGPWHLVRSVSLPRHQLSHQRLHAVVHRIETPAFTPAAAAMAVPADSLGDYAVPRLVDRYLMQAGSDDSSF